MDLSEASRDRRKHFRVAAHYQCARVTDLDQPPGPTLGVTENISRAGLLIRWRRGARAPSLPQVGDPLGVLVKWPSSDQSKQRYLQCWGHVTRVSAGVENQAARVAVSVLQMGFLAYGLPRGRRRRSIPQARPANRQRAS
jgi:hypothetical protein